MLLFRLASRISVSYLMCVCDWLIKLLFVLIVYVVGGDQGISRHAL